MKKMIKSFFKSLQEKLVVVDIYKKCFLHSVKQDDDDDDDNAAMREEMFKLNKNFLTKEHS